MYKNIPFGTIDKFNVVIEISSGASNVKYEIDEELGVLRLDRFLPVAMYYPCNYGFIPSTQGGDGDPLDALIICDYPIMPGVVISCKAIGVLVMEDESGQDEKIIAVPIDKISPQSKYLNDIEDLSVEMKSKIQHFFEHYKDLDKDKWVKIKNWDDSTFAKKLILDSVKIK